MDVDREVRRSLALHAAVLAHLRGEPERVSAIAIENLARLRARHSGALGSGLLAEWEQVLSPLDLDAVAGYLVGRSEHEHELRRLGVWVGVLPPGERDEIIASVNNDRGEHA